MTRDRPNTEYGCPILSLHHPGASLTDPEPVLISPAVYRAGRISVKRPAIHKSTVSPETSLSLLLPRRLRSGSAPAPFRLRSGSVPAPFRLRSGSAPAPLRLRAGSAAMDGLKGSCHVLRVAHISGTGLGERAASPPTHLSHCVMRHVRLLSVTWRHTAVTCVPRDGLLYGRSRYSSGDLSAELGCCTGDHVTVVWRSFC